MVLVHAPPASHHARHACSRFTSSLPSDQYRAHTAWCHACPSPPAINTGRTLPLFEAAVKAKGSIIPAPDVLIAGVGTRIYWAQQGASSSGREAAEAGGVPWH
jgi:hypothetical protein